LAFVQAPTNVVVSGVMTPSPTVSANDVNGNRDLGYISNFVANQFQIQDSRALRKYIGEITPDVDFNFEYTSPFTGEKEALRVPISADFFYPTD
jgi:hypothetical protein